MQPQPLRRGIIAASSWTLDRVKLVDHWPQEEHLAEIIGTDQQGGGSAHNLGVDIRKLDPNLPVEGIGLLGEDAEGDFILARASEQGIDTRQLLRTDKASTSFTDVISDSASGKRTFFHHRGTNDTLNPAHFDFSLCHGRILHLGLLGLHKRMDECCYALANGELESGWVSVLKAARAAGIQTNIELVSIAPQRIREIAGPCLAHLDFLIANEYEAGALADVVTTNSDGAVDQKACEQAAKRILDGGNLSVVVVHHPAAAIAVSADGKVHFRQSFNIPPSVVGSTVGAGDAFAAGFLYAYHEAWPMMDSLELAHAVAAASLRATNTVGSVESVQACLDFARSFQ